MDKIVDSVVGRPWGARHSAVRALTRAVAQMGRAGEKITVESLTAYFLRETGLFSVPAKLKGDVVGLIDETFEEVAKEGEPERFTPVEVPSDSTGGRVDYQSECIGDMTAEQLNSRFCSICRNTECTRGVTPAKKATPPVATGLTAEELDRWLDEVSHPAVVDEAMGATARLQKASLREAIDLAHKEISDGIKSPVTYQWDVAEVGGVRYLRLVTRRVCFREKVTDTEDTCYNINGDRDIIKTAVSRLSSDVKAPIGFQGKTITGVLFGYLIPVTRTALFLDGSPTLRMWVNKRSPTFTGDVGVKLYITPVVDAPYFLANRVSLKK